MRFRHTVAFGLVLALPILCLQFRAESSDGILNRLHHHNDCGDAKQTVVQLPAQEIRVETTAPRVTVGHSRVRGFIPTAPAFMPIVGGPFVATVLPMNGLSVGGGGTGSAMLDSIHAMEAQHLQFAKHQAGLQKEIEITNQAALRVSEKLAATLKTSVAGSIDTTQLDAQLKTISGRLDAIERLLVIHDNILKDIAPKK